MTVLDAPLRGAASTLVATFGKSMTLRREVNSFDPATATNTPTPTDSTVRGVIEDYSTHEMDGDTIRLGDQKVTIAAQGIAAPVPVKDKLLIGTAALNVVDFDTVWSGDQEALFVIQVRR